MGTICRKEIRGYFTSMLGYVFIAFMLAQFSVKVL